MMKAKKLHLITGLEKNNFPIYDSEMVANTYLALHKKLGGE